MWCANIPNTCWNSSRKARSRSKVSPPGRAAGEFALTAKFCTLLVSAVPNHFEAWFNLALAHQKSSRYQPSAEAYEEALKLRGSSCEALTNLGIVREQLGDFIAARVAYEKAMKANHEALAPLWNLALLMEHNGQLEDAERYYRQVLDRRPKKRKRASAWATCVCSERTIGARRKRSKAA